MKIAFIGLGNMGGPMAANLVKNGFEVAGFDVAEPAKEAALAAGINVCDTVAEAARGADVVMTMLPNDALVRGVIAEARPEVAEGTTFIDSSTIAVDAAREIGAELTDAGFRFIDAPVSGGIFGAQEGTLAFMVAGDEATFSEHRSLFEAMGRSITYCGELGNGQAVKACNNMILAIQQVALSEAMVISERLGVDPQVFFDVVSNATGSSWSLTKNCPVPGPVPTSPANNDFKPGFATALMLKDLRLAMQAAESTKTATVLGRIVADQYEKLAADGHGGEDFSVIINEVRGA